MSSFAATTHKGYSLQSSRGVYFRCSLFPKLLLARRPFRGFPGASASLRQLYIFVRFVLLCEMMWKFISNFMTKQTIHKKEKLRNLNLRWTPDSSFLFYPFIYEPFPKHNFHRIIMVIDMQLEISVWI